MNKSDCAHNVGVFPDELQNSMLVTHDSQRLKTKATLEIEFHSNSITIWKYSFVSFENIPVESGILFKLWNTATSERTDCSCCMSWSPEWKVFEKSDASTNKVERLSPSCSTILSLVNSAFLKNIDAFFSLNIPIVQAWCQLTCSNRWTCFLAIANFEMSSFSFNVHLNFFRGWWSAWNKEKQNSTQTCD